MIPGLMIQTPQPLAALSTLSPIDDILQITSTTPTTEVVFPCRQQIYEL